MAGNQMVVKRIGQVPGYGKNKKKPSYIPADELGVRESNMRTVDDREEPDPVFTNDNEVRK